MKKVFDWISAFRWIIWVAVVLACASCSREREQKSLTAVAYNYSETSFGRIYVNDKWASPPLEKVNAGDVYGGGSICCVNVEANAKTARVLVKFVDGDYMVDAPIEQPWPPNGYGHYLKIHVLPERQVKLVVSASGRGPRADLLKARLKELRVTDYKIREPHMWDYGPEEFIIEDQGGR